MTTLSARRRAGAAIVVLAGALASCRMPVRHPGRPGAPHRPTTTAAPAPPPVGSRPSTTTPAGPTTTMTAGPTPTTAAPAAGGRRFLLGMYSSGSRTPSYPDLLGYHPEVTYDSSYQDDHHRTCGQPISGLNDIGGYPVIPSVFTVGGDYAGTAQGRHDECYEKLFASLEAKAATIYAVRIDVEFEPAPSERDFKGSFDRIVSIAKRHLPARVKYVFNPNWDRALTGAGYVPASADIIGPDAYNNPRWCPNKTSAQCAADKLDPNHAGSLAWWTGVAQDLGKAMAVPEWGDDYGDGVYIDRIADWAYDRALVTPGRSNNVVYLGYWDSNLNEDGSLRGASATAFARRFGHAPYIGTYWAPLLPTTGHGRF